MKEYVEKLAVLVPFLTLCSFAFHGSEVRVARGAPGRVMTTGDMTAPRFDHTATLLPNGKVLIAAGMERNGAPYKTAALFDPRSGRFTSVGETKFNHGWGSIAALLNNGKVLLAGGSNTPSVPIAGAELYDPMSNTFSLTGSLIIPRAGAIAVSLQNGNVLVVGGEEGSNPLSSTAELYNPSTGAFAATSRMHTKDVTTAVVLKSGKVLVIGASNAELYDPSTGLFAAAGHLKTPRGKFAAALLPDGKVLVAGGQIHGPWGERVSSTEIYDPATSTFSSGPDMAYRRFKLKKSVVTLTDGRVLIGGGADQPEVYNPTTGSFVVPSGSTLDGFLFSTATLLADGEVLLAGGYSKPGGTGVNHAWIYQP